jgi:hypothetical protein
MNNGQTLVKTLDFQLNIQSDNESLLEDATLQSRSVYNETIRLAKQGVDWDTIPDRVADDADLVKNTTQRVVAKAIGAMENHSQMVSTPYVSMASSLVSTASTSRRW